MKVNIYKSNYHKTELIGANSLIYPTFGSFKLQRLKQLKFDIFQKTTKPLNRAQEKTVDFFTKPDCTTVEKLKKLSKEEIKALIKIAKENVEKGLEQKVLKFTNILEESLNDKYGKNNYVFVSVGQSPAVFAEIMKLHGIESAICPISHLPSLDNVNNFLKTENFKNYLEYLKTIGLDPQHIKKSDKKYIFTDYIATGKSLETFQKILRRNGFKSENIKFVSLQEIAEENYKSYGKDYPFIDTFIYKYIASCVLKIKYSPSFVFPYYHINQVWEYAKKNPINSNFNMLKFLIMNEKQ